MIIEKITQAGNPILRQKAGLVKNFKSQVTKKIIKDLIETMRSDSLIGMAAPQIGRSYRIFITEIRRTASRKIVDRDQLRVFINPRIIRFSKKKSIGYEGCGSVGNAHIFGPVKRADEIIVEALDEKEKKFVLKARGLLARVIQHELDHINGIIFTDKISDYKKIMSRDEYRKLSRNNKK